jgi:hypothetical protein
VYVCVFDSLSQERLPNAQFRMDTLRTSVGRTLVSMRRSTFSRGNPGDSLWMQLGTADTDAYKISVANLHHLREEYKKALLVMRDEEEEWKKLNRDQFPQVIIPFSESLAD